MFANCIKFMLFNGYKIKLNSQIYKIKFQCSKYIILITNKFNKLCYYIYDTKYRLRYYGINLHKQNSVT